MDELNEKILSAYNTSILGIVDESKKIGKPIIRKVIDFIDARHTGDAKTALKVHKELKKKLGNSFSKVLLKYGDPDDPSIGYMNVRNQWANSLQEALSVPEKHQLAIAKKTLKMSDAGASVMGGMSKKEAVEFLKSIGYSDAKIKKMSEDTELDEATRSDVFNNMPPKMGVQAKSQFELKITTMEDVMNDTPLPNRKTVAKGTPDIIYDYVKKKKLIWKDSPKLIFGGYWYDKKSGNAFMPF
jgi:hypothetical protein